MSPSPATTLSSGNGAAREQRVFVAGASGYIGKHVVRELVRRGHDVVGFARARSGNGGTTTPEQLAQQLAGAQLRFGDVCDPRSLACDDIRGERFDAVVSCLASRGGGVADAWRIDYHATRDLLHAAQAAGVRHFVLLSAICVQKPRLEFQKAKLAFECELQACGLRYSIVRPTAFFKSLAGQVPRILAGKPYLMFGDGESTACKPISEADLARFVADCLSDADKHDRILPIGSIGSIKRLFGPRYSGRVPVGPAAGPTI